jgi:hypothetical protein
VRQAARITEVRIAYKILTELQGMKHLRRSRSRWKDNIKKDLTKIGYESMD